MNDNSHILRIAFITNFIPPYRVTFYQKLCSFDQYEWIVLHGIKKQDDGRPAFSGKLEFPNQALEYSEKRFVYFSIKQMPGLLSVLHSYKPNLIILIGMPGMLSNWIALFWAKQNHAKSILWHAGWESQPRKSLQYKIKKVALKIFLNSCDHVLVYSSKGKKYLCSLGVSEDHITICYNGIEIDYLLDRYDSILSEGAELRRKYGNKDLPLFLYVGGMSKDKNVSLLLHAFAELQQSRECSLWLVGDGPELESLKRLAEELKIKNIKFWGRIFEEVDIYFASCDYFVLPGVGGLALNQALFWKKPCVVSEADTTEDDLVIDGETGFRFQVNDKDSLLKAMIRCLDLPSLMYMRFGENGYRLIVERSNVSEMVKVFTRTIDALLQPSKFTP
ncbi:MAG: glycosyltransferase [Anaerolineales bacterium]|nr:glycosyltransferase [Anaerolineales bacterium]